MSEREVKQFLVTDAKESITWDIGKATPGPWIALFLYIDHKVVDCFVAARNFNNLPYESEILGDDEYTEEGGIDRKIADAILASVAPDAIEALKAWMLVESEMLDNNPCPDIRLRDVYRKNAIELTKQVLSKLEKDK